MMAFNGRFSVDVNEVTGFPVKQDFITFYSHREGAGLLIHKSRPFLKTM